MAARYAMRVVSTLVLPDPAPARMHSGAAGVVIMSAFPQSTFGQDTATNERIDQHVDETRRARGRRYDELGEARFYLGQWHLLRGDRVEAKMALQAAAEACPPWFNEHVAADPRSVQVLLTVRDGMTLIRRA